MPESRESLDTLHTVFGTQRMPDFTRQIREKGKCELASTIAIPVASRLLATVDFRVARYSASETYGRTRIYLRPIQ